MKIYRMLPAILAVLLVGPPIYWILDNVPPIEVHDIQVVNNNVARGEAVIVRYHLTYNRVCSGDAQRLFIDSTGTLIPIEPYRFLPDDHITLGRARTIDVAAPVPFGTSPGLTKYQTITEFFCNPIQRAMNWGIVFKFPAVQFIVADEQLSIPDKAIPLPTPALPFDNPLRNLVPPLPERPWILPK